MPIEIRELHIKINLTEGGGGASSASESNSGQDASAQTVEQVLETIKRLKER